MTDFNSGDEDQRQGGANGAHLAIVPASEPDADDEAHDHGGREAQGDDGPSPAPISDDEDHIGACANDAQARCVPSSESVARIIADIRAAHRQRVFWMEHRKRQNLALGAYLRTVLGWHKDLPAEERKRLNDAAAGIITAGERYLKAVAKAAKKSAGGEDHAPYGANDAHATSVPLPAELAPWAGIVIPAIEMRGQTDDLEAAQTKAMEELAEQLPAWREVKDWKGFGPLSLAIIVAEAGDLNSYPTKAKLYKRLGLAVMDGAAQGSVSKTTAREQRAAAWTARGYSAARRSRIWTIATSMLMSGNDRVRTLYLDRKAYEVARAEAEGMTVVPANKVPKKQAGLYRTVGHVHNRARRYAEKHMICDVWRAWHRAA